MPTMTLDKQNAKVLEIEETVEAKLGRAWQVIKRALERVDPDRLLVFAQAHEIERLQARVLALGFIVAQVEEARDKAIREFARLKANGVDVDREAIEAVRTCLVEPKGGGSGK